MCLAQLVAGLNRNFVEEPIDTQRIQIALQPIGDLQTDSVTLGVAQKKFERGGATALGFIAPWTTAKKPTALKDHELQHTVSGPGVRKINCFGEVPASRGRFRQGDPHSRATRPFRSSLDHASVQESGPCGVLQKIGCHQRYPKIV
jgi:hypothetical protein